MGYKEACRIFQEYELGFIDVFDKALEELNKSTELNLTPKLYCLSACTNSLIKMASSYCVDSLALNMDQEQDAVIIPLKSEEV